MFAPQKFANPTCVFRGQKAARRMRESEILCSVSNKTFEGECLSCEMDTRVGFSADCPQDPKLSMEATNGSAPPCFYCGQYAVGRCSCGAGFCSKVKAAQNY